MSNCIFQPSRPMRAFLAALLTIFLLPAAAADLGKPLILVARPELRDQLFGSSVLVVAPLGGDQHIGFIVNRPTDATLGKLFPEHGPSQKVVDPIYLGGPLQTGVIFALVQRPTNPGGNSFGIMPGLYAAFETDVVDRIIELEPERAKFVAGLVTWGTGELRDEIELGAWYAIDAELSVVMRRSEGPWEELTHRTKRLRNAI
jgi:putative transcriptional regulator